MTIKCKKCNKELSEQEAATVHTCSKKVRELSSEELVQARKEADIYRFDSSERGRLSGWVIGLLDHIWLEYVWPKEQLLGGR